MASCAAPQQTCMLRELAAWRKRANVNNHSRKLMTSRYFAERLLWVNFRVLFRQDRFGSGKSNRPGQIRWKFARKTCSSPLVSSVFSSNCSWSTSLVEPHPTAVSTGSRPDNISVLDLPSLKESRINTCMIMGDYRYGGHRTAGYSGKVNSKV